MKILQTATITIAIVLMIIASPMTYSTLSFAARTNSTGTGTQHNNNSTASSSPPSKIPPATPSQITTKNATLKGGVGGAGCSGSDEYLWNHVYGVDNGQKWGKPTSRLYHSPTGSFPYGDCVTVTGQVYSEPHQPPSRDGTHVDEDGDLHFTLQLDTKYEQYSKDDPQCKPHGGSTTACKNIIVEVICHNPSLAKSHGYFSNGDYCNNVYSAYKPKTHPILNDLPPQGQKLKVTGRLVKDTGTFTWNEIHPASNIQCITPPSC